MLRHVTQKSDENMAPVTLRLNTLGVTVIAFVCGLTLFYMLGVQDWFKTRPTISMKELLCVSIDLAKRGGERVKAVYDEKNMKVESKGKTKQGVKEMLTDGDKQSHRAMFYGLEKAFPGLQIISEEHETKPIDLNSIPEPKKQLAEVDQIISSDYQVPLDELLVWMDPLDATQEYTEGLTEYVTVMLCVALKGSPTLGVIYRPFDGLTYWAWVAYGYSSEVQKAAPTQVPPYKPDIIMSRSHKASNDAEIVKESFQGDVNITFAGGAGYKTLSVISGRASAYVHLTQIKKWDICAGNAILKAVGGRLTDMNDDTIEYVPNRSVVVEEGLLATLKHHTKFLDKILPTVERYRQKGTT